MHVVQVVARLNDGGPARVIRSLAEGLRAAGWDCTVLCGSCADDEVDLAPTLRAAGLHIELIPGLGRALSLVDDLRACLLLAARLRALRADLVHSHTAKAGALSRPLCRLLGLPCLHSYHGHVLRGYFRPGINRVLAVGERLLAGRAHHHALTVDMACELSGLGIGRPQRWHVLPVPVAQVLPQAAAWQASLPDDRPCLLFLGRLAPVKDPLLWLEVLALLAARRPIQGLLCGDGALRDVVAARAQGLPLRLCGQIPTGEALAAADCLLMTSRNEGQPLAAIEAAAAGLPVVAPPVGGLAALARAGLVLPAGRSAVALAARVEAALDAPPDPQQLATRAAAFAPERLVPRYLTLYHRLTCAPR